MPGRQSRHKKAFLIWGVVLFLGTGMACQLTSPRPASWAGTSTADVRNTEIALTRDAIAGTAPFVFTPTAPSNTPVATSTATITSTPRENAHGPWLVFPDPEGEGLNAYDINTHKIHRISLPEPIITTDLTRGLAPDGSKLIIRAGLAENTDELALYQINLPSFEVSKLTPLLSITVQRKIVHNQGDRALETLMTVTRSDGLAWSSDSRYLAFSAALDQESSDLYVADTLNNRIDRVNGLYSQNASPVWSPGGEWLISQEFEYEHQLETWHSVLVSGLRFPSYDSQNTLYLPPIDSFEEVIIGWINPHTFLSYSYTESGPRLLRQVSADEVKESIIFENAFQQAAYDPGTGVTAFSISFSNAIAQGLSGGIYRRELDSPVLVLQAAGDWTHLIWDTGGRFVASGTQGALFFTPQGESILLPGEGNARLAPNGSWVIAWGDGENSRAGARLFQSHSSNPLQTLIDQPVESLTWQPDSKGFLIVSEGSLYHFTFPGLKPEEIITGIPLTTGFVWTWVE